MKLINRHESCIGFTLFKWNLLNIELWFCPPGYEIKPHKHPSQDIELIYLFGEAEFHRADLIIDKHEHVFVAWYHRLMKFSIQHYHYHWFKVSKKWLCFLNIERWHITPTSAADDLVLPSKHELMNHSFLY